MTNEDTQKVIEALRQGALLKHPGLTTPMQRAHQIASAVASVSTGGSIGQRFPDHLQDLAQYHKAAIEVYEYLHAQLNMDPFKEKPEQKAFYEAIIRAGLKSVLSGNLDQY
jgi:hypothetical protein